MVPYVDTVLAATVVRVLLFVLHLCMLREGEGAKVTAMLVWGIDEVWLVWVQVCGWYTWFRYVSSADDVL